MPRPANRLVVVVVVLLLKTIRIGAGVRDVARARLDDAALTDDARAAEARLVEAVDARPAIDLGVAASARATAEPRRFGGRDRREVAAHEGLDVGALDALAVYVTGSGNDATVWANYFTSWTRWNHVRMLASIATSALLASALSLRGARLSAGGGAGTAPLMH